MSRRAEQPDPRLARAALAGARLCEVDDGGVGPGSRWWARTADVREALKAESWLETDRPAAGISYWRAPTSVAYTELRERSDAIDDPDLDDWHGDSFRWFPKGDAGWPYWRLWLPRHPDTGSRT